MILSTRIRTARVRAKLSQTQLADTLGVSRSAVSQWERPTGADPKTLNMGRIATALHINYEWLATGRGPKRPGEQHQDPEQIPGDFALDELESRLLHGFRQLSGRKKGAIVDLIEKLRS